MAPRPCKDQGKGHETKRGQKIAALALGPADLPGVISPKPVYEELAQAKERWRKTPTQIALQTERCLRFRFPEEDQPRQQSDTHQRSAKSRYQYQRVRRPHACHELPAEHRCEVSQQSKAAHPSHAERQHQRNEAIPRYTSTNYKSRSRKWSWEECRERQRKASKTM